MSDMNHVWTNFLNQNLTKKFEVESPKKIPVEHLILNVTHQINSSSFSFDIFQQDKKCSFFHFRFNDTKSSKQSILFNNVLYFQTIKMIESTSENGVIITNLGKFVAESENKEISIQSQYSSETWESKQSYAIRLDLIDSTIHLNQIDLWFEINNDGADIKLIFIRDYFNNISSAYSVIDSIN
jgi:hypothetical protein